MSTSPGPPHRTAPTLTGLRAERLTILTLADRCGLSNVRITGSVARGDARPDSDIDFLVDPDTSTSLLDLAQFAGELEQLTRRRVHVLSSGAFDEASNHGIMTDAVAL